MQKWVRDPFEISEPLYFSYIPSQVGTGQPSESWLLRGFFLNSMDNHRDF